jgi:CRP-like cAMP-binding protein
VSWHAFAGVSAEEVERVIDVARRRTFRRGEIVMHQGDPADSLHLVVSGRFAIGLATPRGERVTVAVRGPGDIFGEFALLGSHRHRAASVHALERGETLCVFKDDFDRLRAEHPGVNDMLIHVLVNVVRAMNERLLEALYLPAERRVLRRVRELVELYPPRDGLPPEIPLTQETIAEMAGTSRATVNAVLGEAQARGLVELSRGAIRVLDIEELGRRAR